MASILVSLSILLLLGGALALRTNNTVRDRFNIYLPEDIQATPASIQELELSRPFLERVVMPLVHQASRIFARLWPQNRMQALRRRILQAGDLDAISAGDFLGIKGLLMLFIVGAALLFGWSTSYPLDYYSGIMLFGLGCCSFFLPDIWLSRKIAKRQQLIIQQLPDALDLLVIVIEAGLSFEGSLQEIVDKSQGYLAREFGRVLHDINIGKARRVALTDMADRTGVADLISFVTAVNQAEELGVSIGRILTIQAEDLRVRRQQRVQERTNQAPIKMLFPIIFLIFPAIFAVLLGPAVPQLIDMFTRTGG